MIEVGDYVKMQSKRRHQSWYDEESYRVVGFTSYTGGLVLILDRNLSFFSERVNDDKHKYNEILEHLVDLDIRKTRTHKINSIIND